MRVVWVVMVGLSLSGPDREPARRLPEALIDRRAQAGFDLDQRHRAGDLAFANGSQYQMQIIRNS
jgi:hypothetical protein